MPRIRLSSPLIITMLLCSATFFCFALLGSYVISSTRVISYSTNSMCPRWVVASPKASGEIGLSWKFDDDPNRIGYNIYRGITSGGGYSKLNSVPITTTSYVDEGLTNDQNYYYVVTAVDRKGLESEASNEAHATATSDPSMIGVALTINLIETPLDLRISDLNGDGNIDYLFSKWDEYKKAYDHTGNLLWEIHPNSPDGDFHYGYSGEYTPTAVWDIDNDEQNEVVCQYYMNGKYYLAVLDGTTGTIKTMIELPARMYKLVIANFRGLPKAQDVAINLGEDVGYAVLAYGWGGGNLSFLWRYDGSVAAHYPKPGDVDGDGKDEYIMGHRILDEDGSVLMDLPYAYSSHVDSIMVSDFGLTGRKLILISEETPGYLYMFDPETQNVLWDIKVQGALSYHEIDIGEVRKDYPGYEIEVTQDNDGQHDVPVYLINKDGTIIWKKTSVTDTEETKLIWWTGDETMELIAQKGVFDGYGNKVAESNGWSLRCGDVTGDLREEYFLYRDGALNVYTNPEFNPNSRLSVWETNPERTMEEYVNYAFY